MKLLKFVVHNIFSNILEILGHVFYFHVKDIPNLMS